MWHWSCALCSFQVAAHRQSIRTKKDASHHERHDIYTTVFVSFPFETYNIPNDSEQETPRYDVVTHHWFHDWRSSMPTELGCNWQETAVLGYWFSCKSKAHSQVPVLNISENVSLLFCISVDLLSSSDLTVLDLAQIFCDLFCLNILKKSRSPWPLCEAPHQLSPAPKSRSRTRNWIPLAF